MFDVLIGALAIGLIWAIMTLGLYISYRILDVADLSVEGTIVLGAAISAIVIDKGGNPYLSLLLSFGGGCLAGLCTGLLHTKLKIPALLAGILTMTALYSVNIRVMGDRSNVSLLRMDTVYSFLENMGLSKNWAVIAIGLVIVLLVIVVMYWFFGTEIGGAVRATGINPNMARAQGIHTDNTVILGLIISNGLVGLSGALLAQYQAFSDILMGTGAIVIGLASIIIGEVLFGTKSFKRTLFSLVLGAIAYRVIIAFVLEAGMKSTDLRLFTSITVAICLSLPVFKNYLNTIIKSARKPDGKEG